MNDAELETLLKLVVASDGRTIGRADVIIWNAAVSDLTYADCERAILGHVRDGNGWLTPADVRRSVKAIRAARLAASFDLPPDADPDDPAAYLGALRAQRRQAADGALPVVALALVGKPPGWADRVRLALAGRPVRRDEPATFGQAMTDLAASQPTTPRPAPEASS